MAEFDITVLFVLLTVALVIVTGQGPIGSTYRTWTVVNSALAEGDILNVPGSKCKPIGKLEVVNSTGSVDRNAFYKLPDLRDISILQSQFSSVQSDSFSLCKNLENLTIQHSSLTCAPEKSTSGRIPLNYFTELTCRNSTVSGLTRASFYDLSYVKKFIIDASTLNILRNDIWDDLICITKLSITSTVAAELDLSIITKLISLQYLALYQVETNVIIDFNIFQSLPNLQTIRFDANVYQTLDFDAFTSLKTVEFVQADAKNIDVISIINFLVGRGIQSKFI